jgi:hypothetical protein
MQTSQNATSYQVVPQVLAEPPRTVEVTFTPNRNALFTWHENWVIPNLNIPPDIQASALRDHLLITLGKYLATALTQIIDQLSAYNPEAVYPIIEIIEPYIETDQDSYLRMPPKSSREVVINVTRQGKAKPKAHLD